MENFMENVTIKGYKTDIGLHLFSKFGQYSGCQKTPFFKIYLFYT